MNQTLTHREAVNALVSAQKSNRGAAPYSRWVNRPIGRHLAATAFQLGLTPNQVSLISAAFTYASIAAIALVRPGVGLAVAVTAGLLFGYALDSADGQLARLRGGGSPAGEWLDHVLDAVKIVALHLAVAISWYRFFHLSHPALLLIPLGFCAVATVFFFAIVLTDMIRRVHRAAAGQTTVTTASVAPDEAAPVLRSMIVLPNDWGVLCLAFLLLDLYGLFEVVYAALFVLNLLYVIAGCARWFRELSAM